VRVRPLELLRIFALCGFLWTPALGTQSGMPLDEVNEAQIVESLKPKESSSRTRSMRNLAIEKRPNPQLDLAIPFEINSDRLTSQGLSLVKGLAKALQSDELRPHRFRLIGHTDQSGGAAYNQILSKRRAESVQRALVLDGVAIDRLQVEGLGFSQLLPDFAPNAPVHRRVTVMTLTE